jgi:STE24 endopeptidase
MKAFVALIVLTVLGAILWGEMTGSEPVGARVEPHGIVVDDSWYAALPTDPEAATQAFLQRISPETRARGDTMGATRYIILPTRIAVLAGSIALILFSGAAATMRRIAQRITSKSPIRDALFAVQLLVALFLLNLPVETYAGYVRFRHAGFSDSTYLQWLSNMTLGWATLTVFYVIGVVGIMALIRRCPRTWTAWATVVYVVVSASYVFLAPRFIEPLFNQITPLHESPVKQAILSLARANGVPASEVFVRDASRQSVLLDAHVSGWGNTAQIVLDDNTIEHTSEAEVRMVMAHEIGHYVLAHVPKGIVFDALVMGLGIVLVGWGATRLVARFGRRWQVSGLGDIAALPVFWGLFVLWGFVALPLSNGITRQQEIEADLFGLNASREPLALAEFMIRDSDTWQVDPSPLEEWAFYHHPSARHRIFAAMRWRAEQAPEDGAVERASR